MIAAAPAIDNGDRHLHHHPTCLDDNDNPTLSPINPQQWNKLYEEFLQYVNSFNAMTPNINDDDTTSPFTPLNIVDNSSVNELPPMNDNEPLGLTPTLQQHKKHTLSRTVCQRDIPMHVSTSAAAPEANNNDDACHLSHPSISADKNSALTPTFLQQWDAFYDEFLHLVQLIGALTNTNKDPFAPTIAIFNNAESKPPEANDPEPTPNLLS